MIYSSCYCSGKATWLMVLSDSSCSGSDVLQLCVVGTVSGLSVVGARGHSRCILHLEVFQQCPSSKLQWLHLVDLHETNLHRSNSIRDPDIDDPNLPNNLCRSIPFAILTSIFTQSSFSWDLYTSQSQSTSLALVLSSDAEESRSSLLVLSTRSRVL